MTGLDTLKTSFDDQILAIEKKKIKQNIFIVNDDVISVPAQNVPVNLLGPFCVEAGKTIDFASQITMENAVSAAYIKLLKNDEVVAIAGMDDSQ